MSVERELGLGSDLESVIAGSWASWADRRPELARVSDPGRLRGWLHDAEPDQADEVVFGLVWLASTEGGDDSDAARVVAWLLVPGASFLAWQLRTLTTEIDHVVAAELWCLVRTFPLRRRKVVVNLMWDLRTRVLAACAAPATLRRKDPTWYVTRTGLDADLVYAPEVEPSSMDELIDVLDWACATEAITVEDRALVLLLVEASQDVVVRHSGSQGLLANTVTAVTGGRLGVCDRTVRRRARRSIRALTQAACGYPGWAA